MHLILVVMTCAAAPVLAGTSRPKRLIGGDIIVPDDQYNVFQYFVWFSRRWECYEDVPWWEMVFTLGTWTCAGPKARRGRFEGALITPTVVQTSCRNLADIVVSRSPEVWDIARVKPSQFEVYGYFAFVGAIFDLQTLKRDYGIPTRKFIIHYNCARLGDPLANYGRYDVGWVILDDEFPGSDGDEWRQFDYAGPYKLAQLEAAHQKAVSEMHACLMIGFGVTFINWLGDLPESEWGRSRMLKHGWIQLMNYYNCYTWTQGKIPAVKTGEYKFDYNLSVSWMCSAPLRDPYGALHWITDLGTPITCNNIYLGLASWMFPLGHLVSHEWGFFMHETALVYVPESMAVEYRNTFDQQMSDWVFEPKYGSETIIIDNLIDRKYFRRRSHYAEVSPVVAPFSSPSTASISEPPAFLCLVFVVTNL